MEEYISIFTDNFILRSVRDEEFAYPVIAPNALLEARHTTTEQLPNIRTPMGASAPVLTIVT